MLRKLLVILVSIFCSQVAISAPAPISEGEYKFLMALNVFGVPGVSPSKLRSAEGVGCVDEKGDLVKPGTGKTIGGFDLACMVRSKPKGSDKGVYIWFPKRYAEYCSNFDSFEECAASEDRKR